MQQINENLLYWPGFIKAKCKQRFIKITQYLIRMRKIRLRRQKQIVPIQRKIERRERRREEKALIAARLDTAIERQLMERLKQGMVYISLFTIVLPSLPYFFSLIFNLFFQYKDIYNFPQKVFDKAVEAVEVEGESEAESEEEEKELEIEKEVELELEADEKERETNTPHFVEAETDEEDEDDDFDVREISMVMYIRLNIIVQININ